MVPLALHREGSAAGALDAVVWADDLAAGAATVRLEVGPAGRAEEEARPLVTLHPDEAEALGRAPLAHATLAPRE